MYFVIGLDDPKKVEALREEIMRQRIEGVSNPIEYTVQGNDFKRALTVTPQNADLIFDMCTEFLVQVKFGRRPARRTNTWIGR